MPGPRYGQRRRSADLLHPAPAQDVPVYTATPHGVPRPRESVSESLRAPAVRGGRPEESDSFLPRP